MGEKTKPCPKCNGTMGFRLGEYTCQQCGYVESLQPEKQEVKGSSGPGFQSSTQWSSGQSRPTSVSGTAPAPPSTLYNPGQLAAGGYSGISQAEAKPIATHEYMLVGCLGFFIPIVGLAFASSWSKQGRPGAETCLPMAWIWFGLNILLWIIGALFGSR